MAKKVKRDYGLSYDPASEILVTVGGTEALFIGSQALITPRDEVLIPDTEFICYKPDVSMRYICPNVKKRTSGWMTRM